MNINIKSSVVVLFCVGVMFSIFNWRSSGGNPNQSFNLETELVKNVAPMKEDFSVNEESSKLPINPCLRLYQKETDA